MGAVAQVLGWRRLAMCLVLCGLAACGGGGGGSGTTTPPPPPPSPPASAPQAATLVVTLGPETLSAGRQGFAAIQARDAAGKVINLSSATWTSSNPSVATLSPNNPTFTTKVNALAVGKTTITAQAEGLTASAEFTVTPHQVVTNLTMDFYPLGGLMVGKETSIAVNGFTANDEIVTGTVPTVTSSNPEVISVGADGSLKGLAVGMSTITVRIDDAVNQQQLYVAAQPSDLSSMKVYGKPGHSVVGQHGYGAVAAYGGDGKRTHTPKVIWTSSNPEVVSITPEGLTKSLKVGDVILTGTFGNFISKNRMRVFNPSSLTDTIGLHLSSTNTYLGNQISNAKSFLLKNPSDTDALELLSALQKPGLADEIIGNRQVVTTTAKSRDGHSIPISIVYRDSGQRVEAEAAALLYKNTIPLIETMLDTSFPSLSVRAFYGFSVSAYISGGNITLPEMNRWNRRNNNSYPYESMAIHEFTHNYISHEGFNSFLETYIYNTMKHDTTDIGRWSYMAGYKASSPIAPSTTSTIHNLLGIYRLIGSERMIVAMRKIHRSMPDYNERPSAEQKNFFIEQASPENKEMVTKLADAITGSY